MSNIEWKEIGDSKAPSASFGCIGGTLETDYVRIDYCTVSEFLGRKCPPLGSLIDEYEQNIRHTTGRDDYNVREEDPDMSITELLRQMLIDPSDYYRNMFTRDDGLEMIVTFKDSLGRLEELSVLWYIMGLRYPIDTESLTVSNWKDKVETGFKSAAEKFLDSLKYVNNEEELMEKCELYHHGWEKFDL